LPTGLKRFLGLLTKTPRTERQLNSLRVLMAYLGQEDPRRRYLLLTRLMRRGRFAIALVAEAGTDEKGRYAARILAGGAADVGETILTETLQSRISPLLAVGPHRPRRFALHEDPFGPGTAFLRKFNLSSALVFPLGVLGDTHAETLTSYLLAATQQRLSEADPIVKEMVAAWSIWQWIVTQQRQGRPAPEAETEERAWPGEDAWTTAPVGMAIVANDDLPMINQAAISLLRDCVGQGGHAWRTWLLAAVRRLEANGREREQLIASKSRERTLELALGPVLDAIQARVVVIRDATAEAMADSRRAETISTLSHELRTPLTSMKNSVGLLLRGEAGELSSGQRRFMLMTMRNIDRLDRLIGDLLDISSAAAGKLPLRRQLVDLGVLLHEAAEMLYATAKQRKITLDTTGLPKSFSAHVDSDKVVQMIHNTVGNALKYTEEGGYVRIGLRERAPRLPELTQMIADLFFLPLKVFSLAVEDNGMGMSQDVLRNLFHPFRRGVAAQASQTPGSGLGLHITRALVEAHGGNIEIDSRQDVGTTVWIMLPRDPDSERVMVASRRLAEAAATFAAPLRFAFLDARRPDLELPEKDINRAQSVIQGFLSRILAAGTAPAIKPAFSTEDLMSARTAEKSAVGEVHSLAPGLWGTVVVDWSRLQAAWEVERARPGCPSFLATSKWQTVEPPSPVPEPDTSALAPKPVLPDNRGVRAPNTEER
jgi:signal transduction histidine kinase